MTKVNICNTCLLLLINYDKCANAPLMPAYCFDSKNKNRFILTTPSIAIYKTLLGLTMENILSINSKIRIIISSSFLGAGLEKSEKKGNVLKQRLYNAHNI